MEPWLKVRTSKFSSALDTRRQLLSSLLHSLTSNTETEEKPSYFKLQEKKTAITFFIFPTVITPYTPEYDTLTYVVMYGKRGNKTSSQKSVDLEPNCGNDIFPCLCSAEKRKTSHRDFVIRFEKNFFSEYLANGRTNRVKGTK